ncbi:hypothetical protein BCR36DRAFT_409075 [Piromyces finnis]|uniref:Uncharacterized protein n=1 Tax=Piromyces finnis TaxID=1754191 RepID=A0A1Y1VL00_9FUNG|nr:hypothetical protein BCR36DRAFT_409075 [Piromyces finnis]|eukprot:ORX58566.1 hypothetical protein BCR36DRAFT_409075 [Piromyces finnis]
MNKAPKGKTDSSLKSKLTFNPNNQNSNNSNNSNNVGQNNSNNDKEGEQENEHIIECMNILNEQEEAEQFAISLLEEIIWNAETLLFEKYIEKQIIPFTLNFFENKIMEIIDWNFFKYDNGLINEDAWNPDKELTPIINDSWARGAIPVKQIPKKKSISVKNDTNAISITKSHSPSVNENKKYALNKNEKVLVQKNKTKKLKENPEENSNQNNKNTTALLKKEKNIRISEAKSKKIKQKTNTMHNTVKNDKSLNSKEKQKSYIYKNIKNKIEIGDIINNKQSTIQIQNMNKDGWNIDNIYNYTGNLISSIKTSPDKSFEQSVKAKIIEPINTKQVQNEKGLYSKKNKQEKKEPEEETIKLSAIHNNNLSNDIEKLQNDINVLNNFIRQKNALSSEAKKTLQKKNIVVSSQKLLPSKIKKNGKLDKLDPLLNYNKNELGYNYEKYTEDISLEIPSFINSINIAPGVKLSEGNTFKSGPSLNPNNEDKESDPKILLLKKRKQNLNSNKKDPRISNELLKDIILKINPSLKSSE